MLRAIAPAAARRQLYLSLGLPDLGQGDTSGPPDQAIAECLRTALVELACPEGTNETTPVYVQTLLGRVRRQLRPLWPALAARIAPEHEDDSRPDPLRRVLETLEILGDCAHVGSGYWLPTPIRYVRLPTSKRTVVTETTGGAATDEDVLVLGGVRTKALRQTLHAKIGLRWIARTLPSRYFMHHVITDRSRWQSIEAWLGYPPEDLAQWTRDVLQRAVRSLAPISEEVEDVEAYCPDHKDKWQRGRWRLAASLPHTPDVLMLCRSTPRNHRGARTYWLGTFTRGPGGIVPWHEASLTGVDRARLVFGLDALAKRRNVAFVRTEGRHEELIFWNPFPYAERRFLLAFGEDVSPNPGRYPLRYRFDVGIPDAFRDMLDVLGVDLHPLAGMGATPASARRS